MSDSSHLNCLPLFDSHFHIIDHRFPLTPNNGYLPGDLTCAEYRTRMACLIRWRLFRRSASTTSGWRRRASKRC